MTRERYQLLGFDGGTEDLAYVSFPAWRLGHPRDGKMLLAQLARGRALIVIDSLRASIGGDENSSEIRQWLDGVSEVSEATQCTILILHHAKKGGADGGDDMYKARGSSGIVDAAGTFWHLNLQDRDPDTGMRPPSTLVQTKPGRHPPGGVIGETPFAVVPNPDGSVGLSLETQPSAPSSGLTDRVLRCVTNNQFKFRSANQLVEAVGADRNATLSVLRALKAAGIVLVRNGYLTTLQPA
jgi:hypothetical protein